MAYCRNCGEPLTEGTKFCPNCGTPVEPVEESRQGEKTERAYSSEYYDTNRDSGGFAEQNRQNGPGPYDHSGADDRYYNTGNPQPVWEENIPGKKEANRSMVLGIIGTVLLFFGFTSIVSFILGIIGLNQASRAKQQGCMDGNRTAGFVLSLISLVGGAVVFLIVIIVLVFVGTAIGFGMSAWSHELNDLLMFL